MPPIKLLDVHDDIDVVGADLVVLEERRTGVRGDVNLTDCVEKESLLNATGGTQLVQQCLHRWELREEFLDDLAHCLEDGVVEDACLVV